MRGEVVLDIVHPGILYAKATQIAKHINVTVLRCELIDDSDPWYQPILRLVGDEKPVINKEIETDALLVGCGEMIVYLKEVA